MVSSRPIDVTAAIVRRHGKVLVARRAVHKSLAGFWEFPGGKVEEGEAPSACLARELEEEFNIAVAVGELFAENVHDYGDKVVRLLAYETEHTGGEFCLTDHDALAWRYPHELLDLELAAADVEIARRLARQAADE